ncbi:hypothetical protein [Winogradskyella sp.]|uniref:hypothetical protein n=1 Tax=Winogradskyella sp. TaxID=1883156 RepID=UPI002619ABA6|nr:hypothetical protein [Winogradskyella sp.]
MKRVLRKTKFSEQFEILKEQNQLEFVDILVDMDIPLFISPWLISASDCDMSYNIEVTLKKYFEKLLVLIKNKEKEQAIQLLMHLHEPKEIHMGYGYEKFDGKAIGREKAEHLYNIFSKSKAAQTTLLSDICYSQLLINGIGSDNVSDMIASICRGIFAEFTMKQCILNGVDEIYNVKIDVFDVVDEEWKVKEMKLPVHKGEHIILIPKKFISRDRYYPSKFDEYIIKNKTIPELTNGKQLSSLTGLFRILKDKTKKPRLKAFYAHYGKQKKDLFDHVVKYGDLPLLEFKKEIMEKYSSLTDREINNTVQKYLNGILKK